MIARLLLIVSALLVPAAVAQCHQSEPANRDQLRPTDPKLAEELLRRSEVDQRARVAFTEWSKQSSKLLWAQSASTDQAVEPSAKVGARGTLPQQQKLTDRIARVDAENTRWLKGLVERQGWPTISQVGKRAAHASWLLVQHADQDPEFQRRCLELMNRLPAEEVIRQDLAYLTDRVLLAEGKKQRYGTQFVPQDGRLVLRPTEDRPRLDERRSEVGLPPVAEYLRVAEEVYGYRQAPGNLVDAED